VFFLYVFCVQSVRPRGFALSVHPRGSGCFLGFLLSTVVRMSERSFFERLSVSVLSVPPRGSLLGKA